MSEVVQVALVTGGIGLLSLLFSLFFNFSSSSRDRQHQRDMHQQDIRVWYERTLFDRRLEAIQEGARWLDQVADAMYDPEVDDRAIPLAGALEWYGKNIIYIHGGIPDKSPVAQFLFATEWYLRGSDPLPDQKLWRAAKDFLKQQASELLEPVRNDH